MIRISLLTFISLLLLAILKQSHGFNQTATNQRWTFTDDDTEFYDDDHDIGRSASNYASMIVKTTKPITHYQPILLVPHPDQPVQNVVLAKVTPAKLVTPAKSAIKSPYDTPPGSFTPQSYGGPSNYGKKNSYGRPIDLYSSYLSSNTYQYYNQYCKKAYGQKAVITTRDLDQAFAYAFNEIQGYAKMEASISKKGGYLNVSTAPYSSSARHQIGTYLTKLSPKSFKEKEALIMEYASKYLYKYKCLSKYDVHFLLPNVRIKDRPLKDINCNNAYSHNAGQKSVDCSKAAYSRFRTADGVCNNLKHPFWGKSNVCHIRLVAPAYEDGISVPRTYSYQYGKKLPSARAISNYIHYDRPDRFFYTSSVMAFGQFVNHDITLTPQTKPEFKGDMIDCCKKLPNYKGSLHPQCLPIELDANDYQATNYGKTCLNFVRSAPCPLCSLGPRQQLNSVTSFLDLSVTYGSTLEVQQKLRTFVKGLLKVSQNKYGNVILPKSDKDDQCSKTDNPGYYCFLAGDVRNNQNPLLMAFHLLFLRNHNLHAENLARINPTWSDEILFQEARRLNIAEYQHIIYEEYLPLIFGPTLSSYYNLNADGYETYNKYDYKSKALHYRKNLFTIYEPRTDPTTWNDYVAAVCRYGHSQVGSFFSLIGGIGYNGKNYTGNSKAPGFWLRDAFFTSDLMHDGYLDSLIKGMVTDLSMLVDPHVSDDIKNHLYRAKGEKVGSDLISTNIHRLRDHGLPGYTVYIEFCFGEKIRSWYDLKKYIPAETLARLQKIYPDVRDVDIFTGGISERKFPDASVGPTIACVLGIQYYHLKFGDRYFYSHGYQAGSFTPDQLLNIKESASFANLLCKTADYLKSVQIDPFLPISSTNYEIPCNQLPPINYNLWKSY